MDQGTFIRMRRALASILLALLSFPLTAPALLAFADSALPACCLRHGEHHCVDGGAGGTDPLTGVIQPKCPLYPNSPVAASCLRHERFSASRPRIGTPPVFRLAKAGRQPELSSARVARLGP